MDIIIPESWLKDYLKYDLPARLFAKYVSLSGPSIEKVIKTKNENLFFCEITTNRVDLASIYGFAREANAILPRYNVKSKLTYPSKKYPYTFKDKVNYLDVEIDNALCSRFSAVLIKNVVIKKSPQYIIDRLEKVGVRAINNIVDISNYIMHDLGQPVHTFDYDKIIGHKMVLRESKKGEKITTLDSKTFVLTGGDIVIQDKDKRLIDLCGIMGGKNTMVDESTKNVLLFVQTYNPSRIRKTSMELAQRSEASSLFEKGLDEELVGPAILKSIGLFEKITDGKAENSILDIYPKPYKTKAVITTLDFINKSLGCSLSKDQIKNFLESLEFKTNWQDKVLKVSVPSFRSRDVGIPEDLIEEVARIHGYQNIPEIKLSGFLPDKLPFSTFDVELFAKQILQGLGGIEIYTNSLTKKPIGQKPALRLKNSMGKETEYLRISLIPSIISAVKENSGYQNPFFLFEIANIYEPKTNSLPDERMKLALVFKNYSYIKAKGILEKLLLELGIKYSFSLSQESGFLPNRSVEIRSKENLLGYFGILNDEKYITCELDIEKLSKSIDSALILKNPSKYPMQTENISISFPKGVQSQNALSSAKEKIKEIKNIEMLGKYKEYLHLAVSYHDKTHTLTNKEVDKLRDKLYKLLKYKFGAIIKE